MVFERCSYLHVKGGQKLHKQKWGTHGALGVPRWLVQSLPTPLVNVSFQRALVLYHRTVDGSKVLRHLGCIEPCTLWDKPPLVIAGWSSTPDIVMVELGSSNWTEVSLILIGNSYITSFVCQFFVYVTYEWKYTCILLCLHIYWPMEVWCSVLLYHPSNIDFKSIYV